ncbi:MAG: tRNA preQ1(34) S-adenosylmethionine ribosyltransferase-isomerase QueA, partial [Bdellovibrionota bacterium]
MRTESLDFPYPDDLVATERAPTSRVMYVESAEPRELGGLDEILAKFQKGDVLVLNDTRVLNRRVFAESELEILFIAPLDEARTRWSVLCPATRWKNGVDQKLPCGVMLKLVERGRPQTVEASRSLDETYFDEAGELPLPPYIQKARGTRHNRSEDKTAYQTQWARNAGSLAAPTASLHFSTEQLDALRERGVSVQFLTLHVGLGTFLPVTVDSLDEHVMHAEAAHITGETWAAIQTAKASGDRVWALGTTVTRALESAAQGLLKPLPNGGFAGETRLFIRPGFEYQVVDVLMTNFHQPRSTLLALVSAFAGLETVKRCYEWAIARKFRLFSYG